MYQNVVYLKAIIEYASQTLEMIFFFTLRLKRRLMIYDMTHEKY